MEFQECELDKILIYSAQKYFEYYLPRIQFIIDTFYASMSSAPTNDATQCYFNQF